MYFEFLVFVVVNIALKAPHHTFLLYFLHSAILNSICPKLYSVDSFGHNAQRQKLFVLTSFPWACYILLKSTESHNLAYDAAATCIFSWHRQAYACKFLDWDLPNHRQHASCYQNTSFKDTASLQAIAQPHPNPASQHNHCRQSRQAKSIHNICVALLFTEFSSRHKLFQPITL
jgi:hypothetical protein